MAMIMMTRTTIKIATTTIAAMIPGDRLTSPGPGGIVCVGEDVGVEAVQEWYTN